MAPAIPSTNPTATRLTYSVAESAALTGLSVRALKYLMRQGRLSYVRIGRRILIKHSDLEALLRRATVKATEPLDADDPIRPRRQSMEVDDGA